MKNLMNLFFACLSIMILMPSAYGQVGYQKKKVVVVKKEVDNQGNPTENELILEGKDAEEYINDMNAEERAVLEMENTEERKVTINKNVEIDGASSEQTITYDITIQEKDGSIKKMKWVGNDESEMPDEIREIIEAEQSDAGSENEKEVDVQVDEKDGLQKVKIRITEKGEEKVMEFESEDGTIPEDLKKELMSAGVDPTIILKDKDELDEDVNIEKEQGNRSKGQLGVMIQDHESGVLITDLVAGSSAQKGGLLAGDIITGVDGKKIKNTGALIKAVSDLYAGDEIAVKFLRSDEEMIKRFELKKRTPRTWEEALRKN